MVQQPRDPSSYPQTTGQDLSLPTQGQMVQGMEQMFQEMRNQREELTRIRAAEAARVEASWQAAQLQSTQGQFLNQAAVDAFFKGRGAPTGGKGASAGQEIVLGKGKPGVPPTDGSGTVGVATDQNM